MTHVSKHTLEQEHLEQLITQLSEIFAKTNKSSAQLFVDEFFGAEEKIMFSKRLAAIAMCIEGNSTYRISQLLYMSPSTAERIKLKYQIGKYKSIEHLLTSNRSDYQKFWETLEIILSAGLPPRGRGRWKSLLQNKD